MVTASHNPKQDNGFKVYWHTASQIIPPHDAGIAAAIDENLSPWEAQYASSDEAVLSHALAADVTEEVAAAYYSAILRLSRRYDAGTNALSADVSASPFKCIYTGDENSITNCVLRSSSPLNCVVLITLHTNFDL